MAKKGLSAAKAKKILTDGYVKGKPLTAKQKKYFGAIASGATPLKAIDGAGIEKAQGGKILKGLKNMYYGAKGADAVKIINNSGLDIFNLGGTSKEIAAVAKKIKDRLMTDKFITNNMNATGRTRQQVVESIENFTSEFNKGSITFDDFGDSFDGIYRGNGDIGINTNNLNFKVSDDIVGTIDHEVNHLFSDSKGSYMIADNKLQGQPLYDNYPSLKLTGDSSANMPGGVEYQSVAPEQQVRQRKAIAWLEENAGLEMGGEITEEMVKKLGIGLKEGEIKFAKRNTNGKWTGPPEEGGTYEYEFLKGDYKSGVEGGGQLQKGKYSDVGELLNNLDAYSISPPGSFSLIPTAPIGSKNWVKAVTNTLNKTYGAIPAAGAIGAVSQMGPKQEDGQFKNGGWLDKYQTGGSLPGASGMMYARTSGNVEMEPGKLKKAQTGDTYDWEKIRENSPSFLENFTEPTIKPIEKKPKSFYDSLLNDAVISSGGTIEDWEKLSGMISYHESKDDPLAKQKVKKTKDNPTGIGLGRGLYQFEPDSFKTAANRAYNYSKKTGLELPQFVKDIRSKKIKEASELTPDQQKTLLLADYRDKPTAKLKAFFSGNKDDQAIEDFWVTGHWSGDNKDEKERRTSFKKDASIYNNLYSKKKNGGWLDKYENGGFVPKAQNGSKLSNEELIKRYYNQPTLSTYEEPSMYEKAMDYLGSPMTSLGYLLRGEDLPNRIPMDSEERSAFDNFAFDIINPIAYGNYARDAVRDAGRENYLDAAINAFSAAPVLPSVAKYIPKQIKNVFKRAPKVVDDVVEPEYIDLETTPLRDAVTQPNIFPTSSPLPKYMEPYLSRKIYPFNKEQEIFQSFLPIEAQIKNIDSKSLYYNQAGKRITKAEADKLLYPSDYKKNGGVIEDDRGQWAYPGEITKINSNNITMKGVNYPVLGISDTGDKKMMQPGKDYKFDGNSVTEYPMAQNGDKVVKDFMSNYINSPKFKERLASSNYNDVEGQVTKRSNNIDNTNYIEQEETPDLLETFNKMYKDEPYSTSGSKYDERLNTLIYDKKQDIDYGIGKNSVIAHEYGHAALDGTPGLGDVPSSPDKRFLLNDYDSNELTSRLRKYKGQTQHDLNPTENKSDLDAFRFELSQQGAYDAGTQDIDKKILKKSESSFIKDRLLKNYSEDDLIWLLNNVASVNQKDNSKTMIAQKGMNVEGQKQKKWFDSYIRSDKYLERLGKEFPEMNADQLATERWARLMNMRSTPIGFLPESSEISPEPGSTQGVYDADEYPGKIMLRPEYSEGRQGPWSYNTIPLHEFGHALDEGGKRIPQTTLDFLMPKLKQNPYDIPKETFYYTRPTEYINRLQPLRYLLQEEGIYDAKKKDFKKEDLQKAKENTRIKYNRHFKDLMENTESEEDFIEIMNTIADRPQMQQNNMVAKDGKSLVELNQLTNFTNYNTPQPGGWLDKYN